MMSASKVQSLDLYVTDPFMKLLSHIHSGSNLNTGSDIENR